MVESVRNLDIVLITGVICVVQTLAQVCPYSDQGCACDEDIIICSHLQQIPPLNTGANVSRITQLSIEKGNINTISNNSLPSGLTSIRLVNNPVTYISDDAFDASAATLKHIDIRGAKFTKLPTALQKLTTLTSLSIHDTAIQDWDNVTLKHIAATLENIQLWNVSLSSWPGWISDFHLLHGIYLGYNSLKSIPDDAFSSIKDSLIHLDLSNTSLTKVPNTLSILTSLETLYLSDNNIANILEIEEIIRLPFAPKLTTLGLRGVGLTNIVRCSNLTNLTKLNLSGNRISDVPAGSLPASLTELFFSDNRLSSVPQDVASMPGLWIADLSHNLITGIEPNSFPSSLIYLLLGNNNLTIIANSTLRNLNRLNMLDLGDNPITTISPSEFADLASLQYLYLINSNLTEIPLPFAQLSPQIDIHWTTTQPLSCPCPAPQELVQWFSPLTQYSLKHVICSNGQSVASYLSGQCGPPKATP